MGNAPRNTCLANHIVSYHLCYIVMIYIGAVLPMDLVWGMTDLINGIMVFPNVIALFALRKKIHI